MPMVSRLTRSTARKPGRRARQVHGDGSAVDGAIALHAIETIDDRDSPIAAHMKGCDCHVIDHGVVTIVDSDLRVVDRMAW